MEKFKGTKGEWYYHQETPRTLIIGSDQHYRDKIIKVWSDDCISNKSSLDEAESNAKLIAAAPDLLDALQNIVSNLDGVEENDLHNNTVQYYFQSIIKQAKEAIEKALK